MNPLEHAPAMIIALPLLAAFITPLLGRFNKKLRDAAIFVSLAFTLLFVWFLASQVLSSEEPAVYVFGAYDSGIALPSGYNMPVRIMFEIDAMGAYMAVISSILAFLGFIYSLSFMKKETGTDKYYALMLLLTAGMFGMVLTGDLFNFFVFLEVTSIAACALVAFRTDRGISVHSGFRTMVMYTVSALFVLLAIALLYGEYGALNMGYISSVMGFGLVEKMALVMFLAALALKAGAFPMHMWVPDAYGEAPSPISLILIGNSQASLYALFRICFTLYGLTMDTMLAGWVIILLGMLSMFVGVTMAITQRTIKRLIAYTAVSQTGYMLLGVGVGLAMLGTPAISDYGTTAMKGGIFHMFNDALCMGLLFLVAGAIAHTTGIRTLDDLSGLARNMRYTTIFFIIGAAAISGLPPFNGFVSKLLIYESVYKFNPLLSVIAILMSIVTLATFVIVFHGAFLGPRLKKLEKVREAPTGMLVAMAILCVLIVLFGLFPNIVLDNLVEPAVRALLNKQNYVSSVMGV